MFIHDLSCRCSEGRGCQAARSDPLGPSCHHHSFLGFGGAEHRHFSFHASWSIWCLQPHWRGRKGAVTGVGMGVDCRLQQHSETMSTKINISALCRMSVAIPALTYLMLSCSSFFFLLNCIALSLSFSLSKKQLARSHRWLIFTHLNFDPLSAVGAPRHGYAVPALRSGIKLLVQ